MAKDTPSSVTSVEPLAKDGSEQGPQVAFDAAKRLNYHLDSLGERVYHECPPGYAFDDQGRLQPLPEG
jgi:hypothetical protein